MIESGWEQDLLKFREKREPCLLYPDKKGFGSKSATLFSDPDYDLLEEQFTEPVPADIALGGLDAEIALLSPGPVNDKSFADQIAVIDEAPESAVMAVVPVVSHDEIAVRRNDDRPEIIPCARQPCADRRNSRRGRLEADH